MTIQQFIEKAIEGGWTPERFRIRLLFYPYQRSPGSATRSSSKAIATHEILLDPLAWKAVGKVEGWKQAGNTGRGLTEGWHNRMLLMIDALAYQSQKPDFNMQKTIEQYLETL